MCTKIISIFLVIFTSISSFFGGIFKKVETVFTVSDPSTGWQMELTAEADGRFYHYCCEGEIITANGKVIYTAKNPKDVTFEKITYNLKNIYILGDKVVEIITENSQNVIINHLNNKKVTLSDDYISTEKAAEMVKSLCDIPENEEMKYVEENGKLYITFRSLSIIESNAKKVDNKWQISLSDISSDCWHIVVNRCVVTVK